MRGKERGQRQRFLALRLPIQIVLASEGEQGGRKMLRKSLFVLLVAVLSLTAVMPVLAAAPATGIVVEGVSVPGIALGDTRAQVQTAYGDPYTCQSGSVPGNEQRCSYPVEGLGRIGQVWVHYRGPDGGSPSASPDDVAYYISWWDSVSGWFTQNGEVNTEWARSVRQDPEAVLAVYPDAVISYGLFDAMTRATDYEQGITIEWVYHFYSGFLGARMAIFEPTEPPEPPPPPDPITRVTSISMYANKIKGNRTVWGYVWVDDEYWANAVGATVIVDWTFPNGSTQQLQAVTSDSGVASFEVRNVKSGTHRLEVVDVVFGEHPFDREYGTLTSSIKVK
jgi:hypothetical protein